MNSREYQLMVSRADPVPFAILPANRGLPMSPPRLGEHHTPPSPAPLRLKVSDLHLLRTSG
jgi:hypothetical protein